MTDSIAGRTLSRLGRDVTLHNYEKVSEDDYGENYSERTGSPHTVTARVVRSSGPEVQRDAFGADVDVDAEIYIEDGTTAASNIVDSGGDGATRIDVDGHTYVVLQDDVQDNGLRRLVCRREA